MDSGKVIIIRFTDFDIGSVDSSYCPSSIVVYDGVSDDADQLFSGCGTEKPDMIRIDHAK